MKQKIESLKFEELVSVLFLFFARREQQLIFKVFHIMNQILFVYFGENIQFKKLTWQMLFNRPTFGFFFYLGISLAFLLFNHFVLTPQYFFNEPARTVFHKQYWRIITAPFVTRKGLFGIIKIVGNFWWLLSIIPEYENKFSTIYLIIEVSLQNLLIQLLYCSLIILACLNENFSLHFQTVGFRSMGWDPIILTWIFVLTSSKRKQQSRLFFLPFKMRNQYLVWILSLWTILFSEEKFPLVVATALGYIQFYALGRSIIKLPYRFYLWAERPLLLFSKYFHSFVHLQDTKLNHYLKYQQQFEQLYGEEQYFINCREDQREILIPEGIEIPYEVVEQQIENWANKF